MTPHDLRELEDRLDADEPQDSDWLDVAMMASGILFVAAVLVAVVRVIW